jgi:hypothetical protein
MSAATKSEFPGGLLIGQSWRERDETHICRVVRIDPALHVIEVESAGGDVERDTIEHFLATHLEEAG